ncbi:Aste57867_24128 [Aphanomyces stellatus]|uniref:Aste57867_24128 protein n=1 Tax=Aphanomyces stellatus TaxID=120398 RepID=A0A485LPU4_9STRA|nr:hypothetical protein As57867_024054 [Aphanomyces stellatus]VFU00770.1 Aste57867_24128 [Aphanomyces stellatus]
MLGSLKNRVLEGGKQLKSTLEEHGADMNQRIQKNININSASERLTAVAAAATNVVTTVAKSAATPPTSNVPLGSKEPDDVAGGPFFASFVHRQQQVLVGHTALVQSGETLSEVFSKTRRRVTAEAQSAMYLQHNFQNITQIRDDIRSIRNSIESLVVLFEEVEQLLMTKTEEHIVVQNAQYALEQQTELERYEHDALVQKQMRLHQKHQERQRALGDAFAKDLQTYQSILTYQGQVPMLGSTEKREPLVPLEAIDIAIEPDTDLDAFYKEDERNSLTTDDDAVNLLRGVAGEEETKDVPPDAVDEEDAENKDDSEADEAIIAGTMDDDEMPELPSEVPTLRLESDGSGSDDDDDE